MDADNSTFNGTNTTVRGEGVQLLPRGYLVGIGCVKLLQGVLLIATNILTIIILSSRRKIFNKTTKILILSVTISDLIGGPSNIVWAYQQYASTNLKEGPFGVLYLIFAGIPQVVAPFMSALGATTIAIERVLIVALPFRFAEIVTLKRVKFVVGIQWLYGVVLISTTMVYYGLFVNYELWVTGSTIFDYFPRKVYNILILPVPYVGLLVVGTSVAIIIPKLRKAKNTIAPAGQNVSQVEARSINISFMLLSLLCAYIISLVPLLTFFTFVPFFKFTSYFQVQAIGDIVTCLLYTYGFLNFFIYLYFCKAFRNEFKRLFRCEEED